VVRDQVLDKLSFTFEDLGPQEVKNIARPVEVYRVDMGSGALQTPSLGRRRWQRLARTLGWRWFAAGVVALGVAGIAVWALPQFWKTATPASTLQPFSIVVLPFVAPAGNPADEQFAEALTNDLTMALGRGHLTHVVSHSLAVTYKGKAIDARAIGRELNVRYLVEGDIRRVGERIMVNAQLIDAGNATQLWSEHLEVDPAQTTQDAGGLVPRLSRRVRDFLIGTELRRASGPAPPGASAEDLALRAWAMLQKDPSTVAADSVMAMLEARKILDQALRLDPNLVLAVNFRAETLRAQLELDLHADHDRIVRELDEMSNRAIAVEPYDSVAWVYRTSALVSQWRWQAALEANSKSSSLDPLRLAPLTERARIMLYMGQPTEALTLIDKALAQDPQDNSYVASALLQRCRAYQALGRYEDAIAACEKSVAQSDWWLGHAYLVAAYAQKGETAKAAAEKIILLKEQPAMTIADLKAQRLSNDPGYLQQIETHFYAGLRKAGIPEK